MNSHRARTPLSGRTGAATDRSSDSKPRSAPRYDPSAVEARMNIDAGLAGSATADTPSKPKTITTPQSSARLYSPTKSQQSRLAVARGQRPPSPRSTGTPKRRPQSAGAVMPSAGRLPRPAGEPQSPKPSRLMDATASSAGKPTKSQADEVAVTEYGLLASGGLMESAKGGTQLTVTASPTGRYAANAYERTMLRQFDPYSNIDYIAAGAPDNDRSLKEASWLASQAFIESLRAYPYTPSPSRARAKSPPKVLALSDDAGSGSTLFSRYTFSGNTYSSKSPPLEHIETSVRRRCGIATQDAEWRMSQLPRVWSQTRTMTKHDWGPFEIVPSFRSPDRRRPGQM